MRNDWIDRIKAGFDLISGAVSELKSAEHRDLYAIKTCALDLGELVRFDQDLFRDLPLPAVQSESGTWFKILTEGIQPSSGSNGARVALALNGGKDGLRICELRWDEEGRIHATGWGSDEGDEDPGSYRYPANVLSAYLDALNRTARGYVDRTTRVEQAHRVADLAAQALEEARKL